MEMTSGTLGLEVCATFIPTMKRNTGEHSLTFSVEEIIISTEMDAAQAKIIPTPMDVPLSDILLLDPLPPLPKTLPESLKDASASMSARFNHSTPLTVVARTITDHVAQNPSDTFMQAALLVLSHRAQTMIIGQDCCYLVANSAQEIAQMIPTLALDVKNVILNRDLRSKPLYNDADPLSRPADMAPLQVRAEAISDHWPLDKAASAELSAQFSLLSQSAVQRPSSEFRSVLQLGPGCHVVVGNSAHTVGAMKTAWQQPHLCHSQLN